jgi:drug/metabolite transporter (DMT)-like permease
MIPPLMGPLFTAFLTFALWSTSFPFAKGTLGVTTPLFLTGTRMVVAGLLLLGYLALFKRSQLRIERRHWLPLGLLSLCAIYLTNVLEYWGLQYLTSAKACLIYSLTPYITALLSYLQLREKVSLRKAMGLGIGCLGFIPVVMSQSGTEQMAGSLLCFSWPELALVGAVVASVYGWIVLRKLGTELNMSPLMSNGTSMLLGGLVALVHSACVDPWIPVSNWGTFAVGTASLIILSNLLCFNLYGWLLKRFTATFLSFVGLSTPLFAGLFGFLFLQETISWHLFVSVAVFSLGLWIVYREELRIKVVRNS